MIKRILICLVTLLTLIVAGCSEGEELKVISFNIRYDNPRDNLNAWPNRASFTAEFLAGEKADLIGLQEVLWHQYEYLKESLKGYESVAVGRDDGLQAGEACPVFFNSNRFEMLENGTFWLSETPDEPGSRGPGAALPRIVTWLHLKEKSSGRKLHFFNTHFCHVSDSARRMSAMIIAGAVRNIAGDGFYVVTGDFNLLPDSKAYGVLTGEGAPYHVLYDTYHLSETEPEGPAWTFNGFSDKPGAGRIDYIFVPAATKVLSHKTIVAKSDGLFISDHWPIVTNLVW